MSTDNYAEANALIAEIEEDAFADGQPGLHLDQRIAIASIRSTLAYTEAAESQAAAIREQAEAAREMVAILRSQIAADAPVEQAADQPASSEREGQR